jgi:hypothetical protein
MNTTPRLLLAWLCLSACSGAASGSNDVPSDRGANADPAGNPGSTALPSAPATGLRLTSTPVTLEPIGEKYLCWSFPVPAGAPLEVVSTNVVLPKVGVHHYVVFSSPGALPANPAAWDCSAMKSSWTVVAAGGVGTPGLDMPEGAALVVPAGSQLVLQLHVLNPGASPVTIDPATIDLVGSTAPDLKVAGVLLTGTLAIDVPAHATDATASGECTLPVDLPNVFAVFPHMHTLGTHVNVSLERAGEAPSPLLDRAWDFGQQGVYAVHASAAAGDRIGITCTYSNPGDANVHFGESTHDEMCFGLVYYWPAVRSQTPCITM